MLRLHHDGVSAREIGRTRDKPGGRDAILPDARNKTLLFCPRTRVGNEYASGERKSDAASTCQSFSPSSAVGPVAKGQTYLSAFVQYAENILIILSSVNRSSLPLRSREKSSRGEPVNL